MLFSSYFLFIYFTGIWRTEHSKSNRFANKTENVHMMSFEAKTEEINREVSQNDSLISGLVHSADMIKVYASHQSIWTNAMLIHIKNTLSKSKFI